jgi:MoaA/NifB/PqqE/SkfB family radical SAM enzyme
MSVEDAQRYIDDVRPSFLTLNGIGEPLLHPHWDDIARHAIKTHGASVGMATTGTLLTENAERLAHSGVGLLKVSFHGGRAETFARLASGRSLQLVVEGLQSLREATSKAGHGPKVRLNYVVTRDNFEELNEALELAAECGVATVYFKGALLLKGPRGQIRADHDQQAVIGSYTKALERARKLGITTNLRACLAGTKEQDKASHKPCVVPWTSLFVRVDGTVLSCCNFTWKPGDGEVGSLNEPGGLDALWRGQAQTLLRKEMLSGSYSQQACSECPQPLTLPVLKEATAHKMWPGFLGH